MDGEGGIAPDRALQDQMLDKLSAQMDALTEEELRLLVEHALGHGCARILLDGLAELEEWEGPYPADRKEFRS